MVGGTKRKELLPAATARHTNLLLVVPLSARRARPGAAAAALACVPHPPTPSSRKPTASHRVYGIAMPGEPLAAGGASTSASAAPARCASRRRGSAAAAATSFCASRGDASSAPIDSSELADAGEAPELRAVTASNELLALPESSCIESMLDRMVRLSRLRARRGKLCCPDRFCRCCCWASCCCLAPRQGISWDNASSSAKFQPTCWTRGGLADDIWRKEKDKLSWV